MPSTVNIRIDIRSSVNLIVFAVIAISTTVFILVKAETAIEDIQRIQSTDVYRNLPSGD